MAPIGAYKEISNAWTDHQGCLGFRDIGLGFRVYLEAPGT